MTFFRSPLSLRGVGTTNTAGGVVHLRTPRSAVIFSCTFPGGGSTKCAVRIETQMGGSTRWTSIGSANSTIKSTQAGLPFRSTSATPFLRARMRLVTRSTGATAAADTISGTIVGV